MSKKKEEQISPENIDNLQDEPNLETEAEDLNKEIEDLNQRLLRVSADFDNFRKRTRTEKEQLADFAKSTIMLELLPVLDNFERALNVENPSENVQGFLTGFEMIFKQLNEVLNNAGLEAIDCVGKAFDPKEHDGVMQVEDDSVEDNIILEDFRKGYLFKGKVIRPSMVKVARNQ